MNEIHFCIGFIAYDGEHKYSFSFHLYMNLVQWLYKISFMSET
jgi:hypothetical protein